MIKRTSHFYLLCLGVLLGCNIENAEMSLRSQSVTLSFATNASSNATSTDTWSGLCKKIRVIFSSALSYSRTLVVSANAGTVYADAGCSALAVTNVSVSAGATSTTLYYKTTATNGSDTVTANFSASETASIDISVATPTADIVLGQPDMTTTSWACVPNAITLCGPMDVLIGDGRVWMADADNNRVLIWNTMTPSSGSAANMVLGQANMTSNANGTTSNTLSFPSNLLIQGTKLFVADSDNNRILIWNTLPSIDQEAAQIAMGQPDLITGTADTGGISAKAFEWAASIDSNGTVVVATDYYNNRVLIWNSIPMASDSSAAVVLGQADMTSFGSGTTRNTFQAPWLSSIEDGKLFVGDYNNHRILVWNSIPTVNQQDPDLVIGQADFTSGTANRGGAVGANTIFKPGQARVDAQGRLFVSDYGNNRILIWNKVPTESGTSADAVIGQTDLTGDTAGTSATALDGPWTMFIDGNYLWFSDYDNNRVLRLPVP